MLGAIIFSSVAFSESSLFLLADNEIHALSFDGSKQWFFASTDSLLLIEGKT